jgi:hypothetical protein
MSMFGGGWVNCTVNLEMPLPVRMNSVTASATDPDGNTAEFSPGVQVIRTTFLPFVRR